MASFVTSPIESFFENRSQSSTCMTIVRWVTSCNFNWRKCLVEYNWNMAEFFTNPKLEALVEDRICGPFHNFCFQLLNMIVIVVRLFLKLLLEQTLWFPGRRKMLTTASAPFPSKSPFFKSCVCKRLGI